MANPTYSVRIGKCPECLGTIFEADEASASLAREMAAGMQVSHRTVCGVVLAAERRIICDFCARSNPFDIPASHAIAALYRALPPSMVAEVHIRAAKV